MSVAKRKPKSEKERLKKDIELLNKIGSSASKKDVEILTAKGPGGVRQICGVFNTCQHTKRVELENFLAEKGFSEFNLEVWEVR